MALGARISERLKALGISQSELARRSGVAQTTVNSLIKEDRRSSPHLMKLAAALRTTPAYLLSETEDPNSQLADLSLSYEELVFVAQLRRLSRDDFEIMARMVDRLAEGSSGYVYGADEVDGEPILHDRQHGFKGKPEGKAWGD